MLDGVISQVHLGPVPVGLVTPYQLSKRLGVGVRAAYTLIRTMRHKSAGGRIWTTEEWLAEWMAAESVPQMNWPTPGQNYDPLEEVIITRAIQLVGEMAARGKIRILEPAMPLGSEPLLACG